MLKHIMVQYKIGQSKPLTINCILGRFEGDLVEWEVPFGFIFDPSPTERVVRVEIHVTTHTHRVDNDLVGWNHSPSYPPRWFLL